MPYIKYEDKKFRPKTLATIQQANKIIAEYSAQGFDLTLRQLYYQFVSRDLIANTQREYSNLGSAINDGRLAGLIDWNAIVDRTRFVRTQATWESPESIIDAVSSRFRMDKWVGQTYRPEVWIEKDALVGVFQDVCDEFNVPLFSCRGYTSQSEMWAGAQRMKRHIQKGFTPVILHFGDHDPSGKDMSRDIVDRIEMFTGRSLQFDRLALNMEQIEQYGPPPNPAKITDSRANALHR
jgi:hypothetical protein